MSRRHIGELTVTRVSVGIPASTPGTPLRIIPPDLDRVAEFVRHDASGRYRPLPGAKSLPTGWEVVLGPRLTPEDVIETVYPLATVHQRQFADGTLEVVPFQDVLDRQDGRYRAAADLSPAGRAMASSLLCGMCVRRPVWDGASCGPGEIPCPEACSVLVSICREAAAWERQPPSPAPVDPAVPFAAFEQPGNELRERWLSAMMAGDE